jgi:ribosomal protein S15P/S13E
VTEAIPLLLAVAALATAAAAFATKRSRVSTTSIDVDIKTLFERIDRLEEKLATTQADLAAARAEIVQVVSDGTRRLEEIVASRDDEVVKLRVKVEGDEKRIKTLEEWIRAQGVDPYDINGAPV